MRAASPAQARAAFASMIQPMAAKPARPMRQPRLRFSVKGSSARRRARRIDPGIEQAFGVVVTASETGAPIHLFPCLVNGEPTAIIAFVRQIGNRMEVTPLFTAITASMTLTRYDEAAPCKRRTGSGGVAGKECKP